MSPPLVLPSPQRTRTSSPPSPPSFAVPAVRSPLILKKSTLPAPSPLSPFLGASLFVFIMVLTHLWFGITVECDLSGHRLPLGKSAVFRSTSSACFYEIDETTEHELVSVLARADRLIVVSIVCTENEFSRIDLSLAWFVSSIARASHALCRWG